jgi:hypothetical protein
MLKAIIKDVTFDDIEILDEYDNTSGNQIVLVEGNWTDPIGWIKSDDLGDGWLYDVTSGKFWKEGWLRARVKGIILMDDQEHTRFMCISHLWCFPKAVFSINESDGDWIKGYLNDPNYEVRADIKSKWEWQDVNSYNVIGEIPGEDTSKYSIVCAHYDTWWTQGAVDEDNSVAAVLATAKLLKESEVVPDHTVKFIAFGGEEHYMRGV